jgi:CRP-like cAMP-binding protein
MFDSERFGPLPQKVTEKFTFTPRGNLVLDSFPPSVRERLQTRLRRVRADEVLSGFRWPDLDVYFPNGSTVVSLLRSTDEGPHVEVAMVGSDGLAGLDMLLSNETSGDTIAVVQTQGEVACINATRLQAEFWNDARTRTVISAFAGMFLEQVSQTAVCNGVHSVAQRLSKWLLALRDRTSSNELTVSHESMSRVLGTQRPAVTLAIGVLSAAGVISHSRRCIHVLDVVALRARACGCFELMLRSLTDLRAQLTKRG